MAPPAVPVPASPWSPATNILAAEHPEVSIGPAASVTSLISSLTVTIAAPAVIARAPIPYSVLLWAS